MKIEDIHSKINLILKNQFLVSNFILKNIN